MVGIDLIACMNVDVAIAFYGPYLLIMVIVGIIYWHQLNKGRE